MSNAYPRPGADEPAWPDPSGPSRHPEPMPPPHDAGVPAGGDDRPLRAVAPPLPQDRAVPSQAPPPRAARADAPPDVASDADRSARRAPDEIEDAVPAAQRLREAGTRVWATVRASVPLRTALFVLPPLVLPALAFDLSPAAALVVSVLLLWLAGAAGVVATMMSEGSDQLALRSIERRLDRLTPSGRAGDDEALLAVGSQLDALNDRLDELSAGQRAAGSSVPHRPQEQWSMPEEVAQNDRYDHDVVSGRHWSPPRWER